MTIHNEIYDAYWIDTNGEVIGVNDTHIATIIRNPTQFGITTEYINEIAGSLGGVRELRDGGTARDVIMAELLSQGWVRVRKSNRKNNEYWTIQLDSKVITEKLKTNIQQWSNLVVGINKYIKTDEVRIINLKQELIYGGGCLYSEQSRILDLHKTDFI